MTTLPAAATWEDIDSLTPWDKNPRKNNHVIEEIAASIRRFGFSSPIIARASDRVIIAGHTRWKAAGTLNMDKVPVRFLNLDPAEAAALALADNKLGELADWDDALLSEVLEDLEEAEVNLDGLGWDQEALSTLLEGSNAVDWTGALGGLPAGDRAPVQTMTFGLHDNQVGTVKEALSVAKGQGEFGDTGNTNSNGNALERIAAYYLEAHRG